MNSIGLSVALLNMQMAIPNADGSFRVDLAHRREVILKMGKAITQLWDDVLAEERQRKVGQKALA